jgi:hypothetical protein
MRELPGAGAAEEDEANHAGAAPASAKACLRVII